MTQPLRAALRLAIPAAVALGLAACGGGDSGTPTPTPRANPAISPVPSGTTIDFERAERLYYEGDFEGAITIYSAAVANGSEEQQQTGLWKLATIQSGRGENSAAERNLEALRDTPLDDGADRRALLLLGRVEFAQGDLEEAREAFEAYVETEGEATPYALLYLAQIESADGNAPAAIELMEEALLTDLPPGSATDTLFTLASHYESEDDLDNAATTYRRIANSDAPGEDASEALWLLGNLEAERGNVQAAQSAFRHVINDYPEYERAVDALITEEATLDLRISPFSRANIYFQHRLNDEAQVAFEAILADPATDQLGAAQARYHLGILSERFALYDDALFHYNAAIDLLTSGLDETLRAQAMWDRATVIELLGRTDEAIAAYAGLGDFPAHERAGEAVFRAGFLSYNLDRTDEAITHWSRFAEIAPNAEERARAHYWLGIAYQFTDIPRAVSEFAAASAAAPTDFYGMLGAGSSFTDSGPPNRELDTSDGGPEIEVWLADFAGLEDIEATRGLLEGEQWERARELLESGLNDRAEDELEDMLEEVTGDPWLLYRFTRATSDLGLPWISTRGAQRLSFQHADPPPGLMRYVYPLEFYDLAETEAAKYDFDPLVTLSMIRQESLYDPGAVSIAQAMGLTQVIPTTADDIAEQLGEEEFTYIDLFRPNVSIRFGAYYLGQQLSGFGGNLAVALAAYNGGPGNAGLWLDAAGGDTSLFVESIDFPETRSYVELVLENYALYRYAYGVTSVPVLVY